MSQCEYLHPFFYKKIRETTLRLHTPLSIYIMFCNEHAHRAFADGLPPGCSVD